MEHIYFWQFLFGAIAFFVSFILFIIFLPLLPDHPRQLQNPMEYYTMIALVSLSFGIGAFTLTEWEINEDYYQKIAKEEKDIKQRKETLKKQGYDIQFIQKISSCSGNVIITNNKYEKISINTKDIIENKQDIYVICKNE